jgi:hypothetical protein
MSTASIESPARSGTVRERVAWPRLLWVAPLTVAAALAVNVLIRFVLQSLNPQLGRMPQLGQPMLNLTIMGCLAAIVVFVVVGLLVRDRPFFWYRVIAIGALLLSWLPDIALAIGGAPAGVAMRYVSPLATFGSPPPGGPPPGGPGGAGGPGGPGGGPGAGPPGGFSFTMPVEQVLVLMLLHLATAVVCIVLLTTLMRDRSAAAELAT